MDSVSNKLRRPAPVLGMALRERRKGRRGKKAAGGQFTGDKAGQMVARSKARRKRQREVEKERTSKLPVMPSGKGGGGRGLPGAKGITASFPNINAEGRKAKGRRVKEVAKASREEEEEEEGKGKALAVMEGQAMVAVMTMLMTMMMLVAVAARKRAVTRTVTITTTARVRTTVVATSYLSNIQCFFFNSSSA